MFLLERKGRKRRKNTLPVKFHRDQAHRNFDRTHSFSMLLSMENLLYLSAIRHSKRASRILQFTDVRPGSTIIILYSLLVHYYAVNAVTTVYMSLLSICHHCLYVTTVYMSLLSICHHCPYVTTVYMSLLYHSLYVTTVHMSPLSICHHSLCHHCPYVTNVYVSTVYMSLLYHSLYVTTVHMSPLSICH